MQTSARDGTGVNGLYQQLAEKLYLQDLAGGVTTPSNRPRDGTVDLKTPTNATGMKGFKGDKKKSGCC